MERYHNQTESPWFICELHNILLVQLHTEEVSMMKTRPPSIVEYTLAVRWGSSPAFFDSDCAPSAATMTESEVAVPYD